MTGFEAPVAVSVWEETDRRRGNRTVVIPAEFGQNKDGAPRCVNTFEAPNPLRRLADVPPEGLLPIMMHDSDPPVTGSDEADPTSVYRYFDKQGLLLYVGITRRGSSRNHEHNKGAVWWPFVVHQKVFHVESRRKALEIERDLIRRFRPLFNRQHNAGSDDLREAYLAYALAPRAAREQYDDKGRLLFPQKIKLLPWTPYEYGVLTVRTDPADAVVATRLVAGEQATSAPIHDARTKKIVGGVNKVIRRGDICKIELRGKQAIAEATEMWMFIKRAGGNSKANPHLTARWVEVNGPGKSKWAR